MKELRRKIETVGYDLDSAWDALVGTIAMAQREKPELAGALILASSQISGIKNLLRQYSIELSGEIHTMQQEQENEHDSRPA